MYYIGVDLGGTHMACGVVNDKGQMLCQEERPTQLERPYPEVLRDMADLIKQTVQKRGLLMADMMSVGIGVPGAVDATKGVCVYANNLYWYDVPVVDAIQKTINKPIFIDNDANCAALAESVVGVCRGSKVSVLLTLGTGVGSGIVIDGKIFTGAHCAGPEWGHMILRMGGRRCTCGKKGCSETYCSATALIKDGMREVNRHKGSLILQKANGHVSKINAKMIFESAKEGDAVAQKVVREYIDALADLLHSIINVLDPDVIAIGGGVSKAGDFLLEPLREKVLSNLFYPTMQKVRIELATLGNEAGIIGAALLGKNV